MALPSAPTYKNKGTNVTGTANITVGPPATYAIGDLLILMIQTANQAVTTPTTTTGTWTEVGTQASQGTGTAGVAGATRLAVYWKWCTAATEGNTTVIDTGNRTMGITFSFSGVNMVDPFEATASGVTATASLTAVPPSVTPQIPNTLIVNMVSTANTANSTNQFANNLINANLTNITERHDQSTNSGVGGGYAMWTADLATSTATGTGAVVNGSSSAYGYLTLALKGQRSISVVS